MNSLPPVDSAFMSEAPTLDVSLLIPARNSAHAIEATVAHALEFLNTLGSFEIILIPNSSHKDSADKTAEIAARLSHRDARVRVVPHDALPGKGAALRTGAAKARGKWIFFTDADLPYDLEFFTRALPLLESGTPLVTGNRRLSTSVFDIPVELLPVAYGRHRLGLAFNRFMRAFLPIDTSDSQAGIKAMSRELARKAFAKMECPGFFFDLEIFLTASSSGFKQHELPVTLKLNTEKSTVRLIRDGALAVYWLGRIWIRNRRKLYA